MRGANWCTALESISSSNFCNAGRASKLSRNLVRSLGRAERMPKRARMRSRSLIFRRCCPAFSKR